MTRIHGLGRPLWVPTTTARQDLHRSHAIGFGMKLVRSPFPDVAGHVMEPETIRWIAADRRHTVMPIRIGVSYGEGPLPDVGHVVAITNQLVAPDESLGILADPSRTLPFRLRRQSFAGPRRVRDSVIPRDLNNRIVLATLDR